MQKYNILITRRITQLKSRTLINTRSPEFNWHVLPDCSHNNNMVFFFGQKKFTEFNDQSKTILPFYDNIRHRLQILICGLGDGHPPRVARSNQQTHTYTKGDVGTFLLIAACHLSRVSVAQGTYIVKITN